MSTAQYTHRGGFNTLTRIYSHVLLIGINSLNVFDVHNIKACLSVCDDYRQKDVQ